MLSAIILVPTEPSDTKRPFGPLLRSLAGLVPMTIEGVVRDVTLLHIGDSADVADIADVAGCGLVQAASFADGFARCVRDARAPWLWALRAGAVPQPKFGEDVAAAIEGAGDPPKAVVLCVGSLARYVPALSSVAGVIAPRERLAGQVCRHFDDVVRRARPARSLAGRLSLSS